MMGLFYRIASWFIELVVNSVYHDDVEKHMKSIYSVFLTIFVTLFGCTVAVIYLLFTIWTSNKQYSNSINYSYEALLKQKEVINFLVDENRMLNEELKGVYRELHLIKKDPMFIPPSPKPPIEK